MTGKGKLCGAGKMRLQSGLCRLQRCCPHPDRTAPTVLAPVAMIESMLLILLTAVIGVPLRPLPGVVVDQDRAVMSGEWNVDRSLDGYVGEDYRWTRDPGAAAEYLIQAPEGGRFELRMVYASDPSFGHSVPVTVQRRGIEVMRLISQQKLPTQGYFKLIGRYRLEPGETIRVRVGGSAGKPADAGGAIYADAFQLLRVDH